METWEFLFEIVLLLGAALLLGIVMERLKQNVLIGYLLTGILIGPSGLGLVEGGEQVSALAELGVALLLFTIGLEFSWRRLREFGATAAVGGAGQILVTLLLTMGVALALGRQMGEALAIGAAVSLSSTAIVLRVLGARAELDSVHGRNSLGILLLQDIAVVPLLLLIAAFAQGLDGWSAARDFGCARGRALRS
jgi:CPA2 family monovalent cation:H+ antiporter-2